MFTDSANAIIIGQDKLLSLINSYTIDTLPHSILLEGEVGCGKHMLCNYIGNKFNLEIIELKDNDDRKDVDDIQFKPYPCLYVVDFVGVIPKFQNSILKVLEEPPAGAFLICLCESKEMVLPTIVNRCTLIHFNKYSREILSKFTDNYTDESNKEIALNTFNTPGKILASAEQPLSDMYKLAVDMLNRFSMASIPNVLSIGDKIAFKNEKNKFDLDSFMRILLVEAYYRTVESQDIKNINAYKFISETIYKLNFSISKQKYFDYFLIGLKEVLNAPTRT